VNTVRTSRRDGFTLVELLIGMSLSLMVMAAVLSSYTFLARNFTRSLGVVFTVTDSNFNLANRPSLETQGRQTLAYFAQDVRMASGISGALSASTVTLFMPTATGSTTVTYTYSALNQTLTRTWSGMSGQVIHYNLLGCTFNYYDISGSPYTTTITDPSYGYYLLGVKQLSFALTAQGGSKENQTLTQVYRVESPRLLIRNRSLLP
jgi:prepilin-type N-terminal cleavage/methylation domain-containing protein